MRKHTFLLLILFIYNISFAQSYDDFQIDDYNLKIDKITKTPYIDKLQADPEFSYQSIEESGITTYDEFIDLISSKKPEFFEQVVVIHSSGSLQPSSLESPRILLYNKNLVLAFSENNNPKKTVEMMEFDDKELSISFHEIVFEKNKKPIFLKNAQKCTACHGNPARPIWEAYDFWPTALGSFSGGSLSATEKSHLEKIKTNTTSKLRKNIQKADLKSGIDTFTAYLSQINFLIGLNNLKTSLKQGSLRPYRFYLLGILSCTDLSYQSALDKNIIYKRFLPQLFEDKLPITFKKVYDDTVTSNATVKDYLFNKYLSIFPDGKKPHYPESSVTLDRLRNGEIAVSSQLEYILANYGHTLKEFTLSSRKDNYILSTPNIFELDLQRTLIYIYPELLSELKYEAEFTFFPSGHYTFDCNEIEKKSIAELKKLHIVQADFKASFESALLPNKTEATMTKCLRCHSSKSQDDFNFTPYIPFDNTAQLGLMLKSGLYEKIIDRLDRKDDKQMPKGFEALSTDEKTVFLEVLKNIKDSAEIN